MALNFYLQTLQGFLRDRAQRTWNTDDLTRYINRARREIAMRTQCIRNVPPTSGAIEEIQVTNPGTGYTNPTVIVSGPDLPNGALPYPAGAQATADAQIVNGGIGNISVSFGGNGYFQPTVAISDPTGHGATAVAITSPINILNPSQERYNFTDFPIDSIPGVSAVFAVLNVSILYNNLRYRLIYYPFSQYQAFIRNYPFQYSYVPVVYTQLQDGVQGSLLFYPFPSQQYVFEPDCLFLPIDLGSDSDYEAIGYPWQDSIAYLAAAYAFEEAQAYNNARYWLDIFKEQVNRHSIYARPGMTINPYGRA